jgi:hypothetical protein
VVKIAPVIFNEKTIASVLYFKYSLKVIRFFSQVKLATIILPLNLPLFSFLSFRYINLFHCFIIRVATQKSLISSPAKHANRPYPNNFSFATPLPKRGRTSLPFIHFYDYSPNNICNRDPNASPFRFFSINLPSLSNSKLCGTV